MEKRKRDKLTHGYTTKIDTQCGKLFITINSDENGIIEVFCRMGKSGGCESANNEVIGRLISIGCQYNVPIEQIIKQLVGINCGKHFIIDGENTTSCIDALGKILNDFKKEVK